MPVFEETLVRLLSSARATLQQPGKQFGEDTIDWMHRLAKLGYTPMQIAETTEIPFHNVEYWFYSNGYEEKTSGIFPQDEEASMGAFERYVRSLRKDDKTG